MRRILFWTNPLIVNHNPQKALSCDAEAESVFL